MVSTRYFFFAPLRLAVFFVDVFLFDFFRVAVVLVDFFRVAVALVDSFRGAFVFVASALLAPPERFALSAVRPSPIPIAPARMSRAASRPELNTPRFRPRFVFSAFFEGPRESFRVLFVPVATPTPIDPLFVDCS